MKSKTIRSISKPRFEALSYARVPIARDFSQEIEWFSSQNNAILGVILIDKRDKDNILNLHGSTSSNLLDENHELR